MSLRINKVMFAGRLVRDPDEQKTRNGKSVCNVILAQASRAKDADGKWTDGETIFVDVAIWGSLGESFARHHRKGDLAFIEGHLRYDNWTDRRSGEVRTKVKIEAERWEVVPR